MDDKLQDKPNAMSSLSTWLCYLEHLHNRSIELGLSRILKVAKLLDVEKPAPYVITVAGTNGKGTTCRILEMILLAANYRVGVYSSPHLLHYTERVRINNQHLPDQTYVAAFELIEQARGNISLTYFEFSTLAALLAFKQSQVDVVILEVGLGGRLDATNIVDSDIAIITSIALDHTDWLGDTRESIGREKAGIFRAHHPAIVGEPDMPQSISDYAQSLQVDLFACKPNKQARWSYEVTDEDWRFYSDRQVLENLPLPHVPLANAATAVAALVYSSLNIDNKAIKKGILKASLPGRMQTVMSDPLVILDVAHNPHAAKYLEIQLTKLRIKRHKNGAIRFVIGMLSDKDIASTLHCLSADYWYCGSLYGERGASALTLAQYLPKETTKTFTSVFDAWQCAFAEADRNDIIVVCGSFHTVAEVMEKISNE
ncbi:MAG: bifunctional tetrahydrofolate synthase/dihydrofolate synthase [Candidatus Schmidhempelia sp.]|nr:bifunctional tetrahydrofolate synthase/dihydrofolate synthase [Candidatus Schmidhempelia sp.]